MDQIAYVSDLIGKPWQADGLHCWALTRKVVKEMFGIDLPAILEAPSGRRTKAAMFSDNPARAGWIEARPPVEWAVALMHRRQAPPELIEHAGVYLPFDGGGVLHVDDPHGVVFDSLYELPKTRPWAKPILMVPVSLG